MRFIQSVLFSFRYCIMESYFYLFNLFNDLLLNSIYKDLKVLRIVVFLRAKVFSKNDYVEN